MLAHGACGILTEVSSTKALATSILKLLVNQDLRRDMGQKGIVQAKNYQWGKLVQQFLQIYQSPPLCDNLASEEKAGRIGREEETSKKHQERTHK